MIDSLSSLKAAFFRSVAFRLGLQQTWHGADRPLHLHHCRQKTCANMCFTCFFTRDVFSRGISTHFRIELSQTSSHSSFQKSSPNWVCTFRTEAAARTFYDLLEPVQSIFDVTIAFEYQRAQPKPCHKFLQVMDACRRAFLTKLAHMLATWAWES